MAKETKKVEAEVAPPPEAEKDIAEEKVVVPPPPVEEKPDNSKALVVTESEFFYTYLYLICMHLFFILFFSSRMLVWIYEAVILSPVCLTNLWYFLRDNFVKIEKNIYKNRFSIWFCAASSSYMVHFCFLKKNMQQLVPAVWYL